MSETLDTICLAGRARLAAIGLAPPSMGLGDGSEGAPGSDEARG